MTDIDDPSLPNQFQEVAQPAKPAQRSTYLLIDADLVEWVQGEYRDWQGHINDLIRFEKDTSRPIGAPQPESWEPTGP